MKADKRKLYSHVNYLSGIHPARNWQNLKSLKIIAAYIRKVFSDAGYQTSDQEWTASGNKYANIIASYNTEASKRLVVGAHYDVAGDQPGADDNASGVAGVLELARLVAARKPQLDYRIDFVAYNLEEPPFFGTKEMGSYIHAASLNQASAELMGMICFEMIGYFSDLPGSQPNPVPELNSDIPDTGNFIAVAGIEAHREFNEKIHSLMWENEELDARVISFPKGYTYPYLSDQRNYWEFGFPAVMITDTAILRNGHNYHQGSDTIDTLDFHKMSEVVNSSYLAATGL